MSIIIRLQNLPWAANSVDIRRYFAGLSIPEGGVHIVGGEKGDAFIAFSTDEDARQAMEKDGGKIKDMRVKLLLSSRTEMMRVIEQARNQNVNSLQSSSVAPVKNPSNDSDRRKMSDHGSSPRRREREKSPSRDRGSRRTTSRRDRSRSRSRSPARKSRDRDRDREIDRRNDRSKRDERRPDDSQRSRDDRPKNSREPPPRETLPDKKTMSNNEPSRTQDKIMPPMQDFPNSRSFGPMNMSSSQPYDHRPVPSDGRFPFDSRHPGASASQHAPFDPRIPSLPTSGSPYAFNSSMSPSTTHPEKFDSKGMNEAENAMPFPMKNPPSDFHPSMDRRFGPVSQPVSMLPTSGRPRSPLASVAPSEFDKRMGPINQPGNPFQKGFGIPGPVGSYDKPDMHQAQPKDQGYDKPPVFGNQPFGNMPEYNVPPDRITVPTAPYDRNAVSLGQPAASVPPYAQKPAYGTEPPLGYEQIPAPNQGSRSTASPGQMGDAGLYGKRLPLNIPTAAPPGATAFNKASRHPQPNQFEPPEFVPPRENVFYPGSNSENTHMSPNVPFGRTAPPVNKEGLNMPFGRSDGNRVNPNIPFSHMGNKDNQFNKSTGQAHPMQGGLLQPPRERPFSHSEEMWPKQQPPIADVPHSEPGAWPEERQGLLQPPPLPPVKLTTFNQGAIAPKFLDEGPPKLKGSPQGAGAVKESFGKAPEGHLQDSRRLHPDPIMDVRRPHLDTMPDERCLPDSIPEGRRPEPLLDARRPPPDSMPDDRRPHSESIADGRRNLNVVPDGRRPPESMSDSRRPPDTMPDGRRPPDALLDGRPHPDSMLDGRRPHPDSMHDGRPHPDSMHDGGPHPDSMHDGRPHPDSMHDGRPHPDSMHDGRPHPDSMHEGRPHPDNMHDGRRLHPDAMHDSRRPHPDSMHDSRRHSDTMHDGRRPPDSMPDGRRPHSNAMPDERPRPDSLPDGRRPRPDSLDSRRLLPDTFPGSKRPHPDSFLGGRGSPHPEPFSDRRPHPGSFSEGRRPHPDSFPDDRRLHPEAADNRRHHLDSLPDGRRPHPELHSDGRRPPDSHPDGRRLPLEPPYPRQQNQGMNENFDGPPARNKRDPLIREPLLNISEPPIKLPRGPASLTVEVRCLPFDACEADLLELFRGIFIPPGNMKLILDRQGKPVGNAFVKFVNQEDFEEGLSRNQQYIGNSCPEVIACPASVFENAPGLNTQVNKGKGPFMGRRKPPPREEDLIVELEGLPFSCKDSDIVHFFDGLRILDIYIDRTSDGRAKGTGFVEFGTPEDLQASLKMDRKMIGHRYIKVTIASKEIMLAAREECEPPFEKRPGRERGPPPGRERGNLPPGRDRGPPHPPEDCPPRGGPPPGRDRDVPSHPPEECGPRGGPNKTSFCVALNGLPKNVTNGDIADFFSLVNVIPRAIHIMLDPNKVPTGEAFSEFSNIQEFETALQQNKKMLSGVSVSLSPIPYWEMIDILGCPPPGPGPLPPPPAPPLLKNPPEEERSGRRPLISFPNRPVDVNILNEPMNIDNGESDSGPEPFLPGRQQAPFDSPEPPVGGRPPFPRMRGSGGPPRGGGRPPRPFSADRPPRGSGGHFRGGRGQRSQGMPPLVDNGPQNFGSPGCVVGISNLHFNAGLEELLDLFKGYSLNKDNVIRKYNELGQATGEARVAFRCPEDAMRAVNELNRKTIMGRSVVLSLV